MKPTIVLAGNHRQFQDFILTKEDKGKYVYGNNPVNIVGLSAKRVQIIGTFWEDNKNAGEIYETAIRFVRS